MKQFLLFTILFTTNNLQATSNNITNDYINSIEEKVNLIQSKYANHDVDQLENDIKICLNSISTIKKLPSKDSTYQENLNLLIETFEKIEYADYIIESIELKKISYSNEYFTLWDQMFNLKSRVDNLYSKVSVSGSIALNHKVETHTYRKKNIHSAYTTIYNDYFLQMKRINECEYMGKIDILESIISLLKASEKLLYETNTKELEKALKKSNSTEELKGFLSAHKLGKDIVWN